MVIEARDGFFESLKKGTKITKAVLGERTWSELGQAGLKEIDELSAGVRIEDEYWTNDGEELRGFRSTYVHTVRHAGYPIGASKDEINQPGHTWSGKIRYRQNTPEEIQQAQESAQVASK